MAASWINTTEGIARFSGHANLYEKYLNKLLVSSDYSALCLVMQQEDYEEAFKRAHTLKGVVGNLSLDRFYTTLSTFVELLRNNTDINSAKELFPTLNMEYEMTIKEVKKYLIKEFL